MNSQKTRQPSLGLQIRGQRLVRITEAIKPDWNIQLQDTDKHVAHAQDDHSRPAETPRHGLRLEGIYASTSEMAVIFRQLVACFEQRAHADDLDVLSFGMQHLFHSIDLLYRKVLPGMVPADDATEGQADIDDIRAQRNALLRRQHTWNQLQVINRTLHRVEPICHLISDAIEGILDTLDMTSEPARDDEGLLRGLLGLDTSGQMVAWGVKGGQASGAAVPVSEMGVIDQGQWKRAFNALYQSLLRWEQSYHRCIPFVTLFAHLTTEASLSQLDASFAVLLEGARTIFGDILPAARTVSAGDDEATATLLFDLIQQSDRLLVQFDETLELLNVLVEDFTLGK